MWLGGQAWEEADGHGYSGVARCQGLPNKGMQPTENSLRSCLAPAFPAADAWRWVSHVTNRDTAQHEEVPMTETMLWPRKTRELHNHHFDSTIWNHLQFRDDDIIIATYAKSGTTWMQQIIAQMLYGPDPDLEVAEMSPWLDLRVPPQAVNCPWWRPRPTDGS